MDTSLQADALAVPEEQEPNALRRRWAAEPALTLPSLERSVCSESNPEGFVGSESQVQIEQPSSSSSATNVLHPPTMTSSTSSSTRSAGVPSRYAASKRLPALLEMGERRARTLLSLVDEMSNEQAESKQRAARMESERNEARQELAEAQGQVRALSHELASKTKHWEEQLNEARGRCSRLEQTCKQAVDEKAELASKLSSAQAQSAQVLAQNKALQEAVESLRLEVERLSADSAFSRGLVEEYLSEPNQRRKVLFIQRMKEEAVRLREENKALRRSLSSNANEGQDVVCMLSKGSGLGSSLGKENKVPRISGKHANTQWATSTNKAQSSSNGVGVGAKIGNTQTDKAKQSVQSTGAKASPQATSAFVLSERNGDGASPGE